ncbi:putative MFS drug efflux transporter [Periconia macrospinosa]|uniref:Putative MFS drug efflux transporter n=1 Tax=Periconia macrospinosa TaxID=97972 RepID=A0A2V1DRJ9_9PLEO|nr:putative MFS drug efflux transporter [Periconia macrospinosa]
MAHEQKQYEPAAATTMPVPVSEKNFDRETSDSSGEENVEAIHQTSIVQTQPEEPARTLRGIKWMICVLSIFSSVFLYALDNTIVATIQPAIINDLGHLEKLPWVSVAFQVSSVALDLTWGKLYGKFDGKILFLLSVFIFEVGSALCGAAPTIDAEIVGRAICGAGGIGIYMGALNLLAVTTTNKERPVYISLMGICWGAGTVLGPVVGGAFADSSATWRWSFYINLVIGAVAAPAYFLLLPHTNTHLHGKKLLSRVRAVDWVGTILISGAIVSGIMGVNFGGVLFAWDNGEIIGPLVCSGVLWILFGLQQSYSVFTTPEDRIFPCDIVRNWEANILFAQTACGMGASLVFIYFIPLYFQFVQSDKALDAGIRLLPSIFLMIFGSIVTGTMLGKGFWFLPFVLCGSVLVIVGGSLMYTNVEVHTSAAPIYGYSVLMAFGVGLFTQGPISVVQSLFPADRVADATAFIGFGQVVGIAIMLAVANAIFLNKATIGIQHLLPDTPLAEVQAAIQGVGSELFRNLNSVLREAVLQAVVDSMNTAYILVIVAGAVSLVLCPFFKRQK